ncbi:MAG: hypothetical protein ACOVQY_05170 [Erythrobacter sp.]
MRGAIMAAALAGVLAGCAGGGGGGGTKPASTRPAPAARSSIVRLPEVMAPQGLEGVIGTDATTLTRRFGAPRIDLAEGDARKLQFTGATCVIDIYLYPQRPGTEPLAAHVVARLRQGGAEVDRGACIREVEGR